MAAPGTAAQEPSVLLLRILDHSTPVPLSGARVAVGEGEAARAALSDGDGLVRIHGIAPGARTVTIQRLGYATETLVVDFAPGATVQGEIELLLAPIALEGVEVTASADAARPRLERMGFYERRRFGLGTFRTRQ